MNSVPHGTGILCPEQLREPAKFSYAASPAHLPSEACHRTQVHATQESQVGAVNPSQKVGSLESAVRPLNCHG